MAYFNWWANFTNLYPNNKRHTRKLLVNDVFGAFAGGVIGGLVAQKFSYVMVFAVLAGIGLIWLLIARTMLVPARAQRLSLAVQVTSEQDASVLAAQLAALNGVQEVTILLTEQRCYLKVSSQQFDLAQAKSLVGIDQL